MCVIVFGGLHHVCFFILGNEAETDASLQIMLLSSTLPVIQAQIKAHFCWGVLYQDWIRSQLEYGSCLILHNKSPV